MHICGIDSSSKNLAIVSFEDGKLGNFLLLKSNEKNTTKRIFKLCSIFEKEILNFSPNLVVIESSIYVSNYKSSQVLAEMIGNIKYICQKNNILIESVSNKTWKKQIIGNGNASKDEIKKWVVSHYPELEGSDQDLLDACCICLFGVKNNVGEINV